MRSLGPIARLHSMKTQISHIHKDAKPNINDSKNSNSICISNSSSNNNSNKNTFRIYNNCPIFCSRDNVFEALIEQASDDATFMRKHITVGACF
eukprot:m.200612 g.200612  ORF g.200612 m.200612 type:complete len:94 (+) comp13711_c0_seq9:2294-2575(+)